MVLLDLDRWKYVGVDGCKFGWFCVGFDDNGDYGFAVFGTFQELLDSVPHAELVLIDIPIGLPEGPGGRECDFAARALIDQANRKRSVFPTPTRQTVKQVKMCPKNFGAAAALARQSSGKGLTRQAFAITPKIAEVDEALRDPRRSPKPCVREVHPELCFWAFNCKKAMKHRKSTSEGQEERLEVLRSIGVVDAKADEIYKQVCSYFFRRQVARDDILDALVAAVTARLVCEQPDGKRSAPTNPPKDNKGLPIEMVYWLPPKP